MAEEVVPVTEEVIPMSEETVPVAEELVPMAKEVVPIVEEVVPMVEKVVPMTEETDDTMVTVEKHVLEENPAPSSGSPVNENIVDTNHRRASVGSKSSTGKPDSVKSTVPGYLRASTGSCHDFCKFGKKHTFEEKPWKVKPKRKATTSSSVDSVLIKVAGEQRKDMVGSTSSDDAKTLNSARNITSGDKTRPLKYNPPSTKKAPSVEPPEVIKKVISSPSRKLDVLEKRATLGGGKVSKTGEKVDRDSDRCPPRRRASLAGDKLSKTGEKARSQSDKSPPVRRASLAGDKQSGTEEKADSQSVKSSPPRRASMASDKLSGTEEKADSQSVKSSPPRRASMAGNKLSGTEEKPDLQSNKSPPPRRSSLAGDKLSRTEKIGDSKSKKSPPPRRASLAGDKLSRTEKKVYSQSDKCPPSGASLAVGKLSKTAEKGDQLSIKSSLRKTLLGGRKIPKPEDKADQQSDKPSPPKRKAPQAKPPPSSDNSSNIKTERKISISRSVKKALAPIASSTTKLRLVRTVSLERKKSSSLKLATLTKDRTKMSRTSKVEKVPEKTPQVIKVETGSSAKSSPQEKDARAKDKYRKTPRTKAVSSEEKHRSPVKLLFRSGKVIELLKPDNNSTPRRLKFRRARSHVAESSNGESTKQSLNSKAGGNADIAGTEVPTKRVTLKRQIVQGKEVRVLFNNVIEETASKLEVSRKSKVKALVGAFETVISLQEAKKKPSSQSPRLSI